MFEDGIDKFEDGTDTFKDGTDKFEGGTNTFYRNVCNYEFTLRNMPEERRSHVKYCQY
jgi:hypothetical protein